MEDNIKRAAHALQAGKGPVNRSEDESSRNAYAPDRRAEPARPYRCNRYSGATGGRFMRGEAAGTATESLFFVNDFAWDKIWTDWLTFHESAGLRDAEGVLTH